MREESSRNVGGKLSLLYKVRDAKLDCCAGPARIGVHRMSPNSLAPICEGLVRVFMCLGRRAGGGGVRTRMT